jgi:hypothetical protein
MSTSVAAAQLAALARRAAAPAPASAPAKGPKAGPKSKKAAAASKTPATRTALVAAVGAGAFSAAPATTYAANKQYFRRSGGSNRKLSGLLEKLARRSGK